MWKMFAAEKQPNFPCLCHRNVAAQSALKEWEEAQRSFKSPLYMNSPTLKDLGLLRL